MKDLFRLYGSRVSFDLTFSLVKNRVPEGGAWEVGVFLGTSSVGRMVPLCIALMLPTTKDAYMELFRMFFSAVGGQPQVIVSDEERALHAALAELQKADEYHGVHLYDSYHILHNIYRKLGNKSSINYFSRLLHAKTTAEFEKCRDIAEERLVAQERELLQRFLEKRELYCFSQISKTHFFGFTSSSSPNEAFHSILKKAQPSQKEYIHDYPGECACLRVASNQQSGKV